MARDVKVKIVGDDSAYQAALRRVRGSNESIGGSFLQMGKHIAGGLAAFAGIEVGVSLVEESVKAAESAQVAHQLLAQQMKNVGVSFEANAPAIEKFTEHLSKMSGFTQTDLTTAFTSLVRVTKDVGKAHDDLAIAVDLARLKHIDLSTATGLVTKAQIGMVGGLRRVGIDVHAVTTNVDALRAAHDKAAAAAKTHGDTVEKISKSQLDAAKAADKMATSTSALAQLHKASSGAADTYGKTAAGAMDRFKAATEELKVKLGTALLPVISKVADKVLEFVDDWHKSGTAADNFRKDMDTLKDSMGAVAGGIDGVVQSFGGWGNVFKTATLLIKPYVDQWKALAAAIKFVHEHLPSGGAGSDFGTGGGAGRGGGGNFSGADIKGGSVVATATSAAASPSASATSFHLPGERTPYDCSAFVQAVFSKNGIPIGSTTYTQITGGRKVEMNDLLAGDIVFFNYGNETWPGHVAIYVGGGAVVHDHGQSGGVSQTSLASLASGSNHAPEGRCYIKGHQHAGKTGGGKAPAPAADTATPTFKTTAKKTATVAGFTLPVEIRTSIAQAALTIKDSTDDLAALATAKRFIESKLGSLKGEQRIQALDALKSTNDQIQQIEDASAAKQRAAMAAAHARQAAALKAHLDRLKSIVTERRGVFESAFGDLVSRAMAGFDRETARGLAEIAAKYGAQTKEEAALADFQAKRAAADLAKSRADALANASTDEERAALALGFSLDDQEKALKDAADTSRTTANKQQTDAENAYNDLRELQKTQLQKWLDEQKTKLETGKTQWDDFWGELVKKADMAGTDTGSAFWKSFAAAGKAAAGDLGGLTSAQIAEVLGQPGGGPGALDPAIAAAIIAHGGIPHLQGGGRIAESGLAVVHRGERVVAAGASAGGDIHVHVAGSVVTERELIDTIRNSLIRIGRNNGSIFGGWN